jgi:hypothetical protein
VVRTGESGARRKKRVEVPGDLVSKGSSVGARRTRVRGQWQGTRGDSKEDEDKEQAKFLLGVLEEIQDEISDGN